MGWNDAVIAEFRANEGRVGGPFDGVPLLLLHTSGRRSGRPHVNPVVYHDAGDRLLVFGSNAGGPRHPDWFHNVLADPQVTIERGTHSYSARAVPLAGAERDREWSAQCARDPGFRAYATATTRVIPVVALHLLTLTDAAHAAGVVAQLRRHHDDLRAAIAGARATPPDLATQLRARCVTLCWSLQTHHTRENGAFTEFERRFPALVPAITRLRAEHRAVESALAEFEALVDTDPAALHPALDRLTADLERHFAFEESTLTSL